MNIGQYIMKKIHIKRQSRQLTNDRHLHQQDIVMNSINKTSAASIPQTSLQQTDKYGNSNLIF